MVKQRTTPWCTLILVSGALVSHFLVWLGNMTISNSLKDIGASTEGWSDVGLGIAASMDSDLDSTLTATRQGLTNVMVQTIAAQKSLDDALAATGAEVDAAKSGASLLQTESRSGAKWGRHAKGRSSNATSNIRDQDDTMMLQTNVGVKRSSTLEAAGRHGVQAKKAKEKVARAPIPGMSAEAQAKLEARVEELVEKVQQQLILFLQMAKPELLQVGKFAVSFGTRVQAAVESFSSTIDRVQKLFNDMLARFADVGKGKEQMLYDTYTLFDVSGSGKPSVKDLQSISQLYGVQALQGSMADMIFADHDADKDGQLSTKEFSSLVDDKRIPLIMSVVLREFAKRKSATAGNLRAARMRDEVAFATVNWISISCAKNKTKIEWVAERLTNGSLPLAFTADVLKQLAQNVDNPNKLTLKDVGQFTVDIMVDVNSDTVTKALELLSDPKFFESEGFDPEDQADIVKKVTEWVSEAQQGHKAQSALLEMFGHESSLAQRKIEDNAMLLMPAAAQRLTEKRMHRHQQLKRQEHVQRVKQLMASSTSKLLFDRLLAGRIAAAGAQNPDLVKAIQSGVQAVPDTLQFAQWLAENTTDAADTFQHQCFEYSGQSSNALNSIANQIKTMSSRIGSFLQTMQEYGSEQGFASLESQVNHFAEHAADDIIAVIRHQANALNNGSIVKDLELQGAFGKTVSTLQTLNEVLPAAVENLRFARKDVSAVAANLNSIFGIFKLKSPPIFANIAALYGAMWTAYFSLFFILTCLVLVYGFWAHGWMASSPQYSEELEKPEGLAARLCCACSACSSCMRGCSSSSGCFWSMVLLAEAVVLLLFVVSLVLCVLAGIRAFMAAGCAQIYILGNEDICSGSVGLMKMFLASFMVGDTSDVKDMCSQNHLMTCDMLGRQMGSACVKQIIGSLSACVFSYLLIVDSAVLFEKSQQAQLFAEDFPEVHEKHED